MTVDAIEHPTPLPARKIPSRSPFRYPGGKGFFAHALAQMVTDASPSVTAYAEPFAGGASAALHLLASGTVGTVLLNDADPRIYAAWSMILHRTDEFIERIQSVPVNMETWRRSVEIAASPDPDTDAFELGFATYFLNRTNRSGIVLGAGPIGGYGQLGRWTVDARYYKETMVDRVRWLGRHRDNIKITNLDGLDFIRNCRRQFGDRVFFFVDPPYVVAGSRLYLDAMNDKAHRALARHFRRIKSRNWAITYDDCALIRQIYAGMDIAPLQVNYSLQQKRRASEVLIRPPSSA